MSLIILQPSSLNIYAACYGISYEPLSVGEPIAFLSEALVNNAARDATNALTAQSTDLANGHGVYYPSRLVQQRDLTDHDISTFFDEPATSFNIAPYALWLNPDPQQTPTRTAPDYSGQSQRNLDIFNTSTYSICPSVQMYTS